MRSVYSVDFEPKRPHLSLPITFLDEYLKSIQTPYDDPVMVLVVIANFEVWKILVDSGSATDILFYETFQKMKLPLDWLTPTKSPFIWMYRRINNTWGNNYPFDAHENFSEVDFDDGYFLVGKVFFAYNAIIGRPFLRMAQAIVSIYYFMVKFHTEHRVRKIRGDQVIARECYFNGIRNQNR